MHPTVWRNVATPVTWELRVHAASMWLGRHAALAGASSARWWGLDGFEQVETVEFVVPRRRRSIVGLTLHTTDDWDAKDLLTRDGVRVTSVSRTIIDMAGQRVPLRQLEAAIDSGIRLRHTSLVTLRRRLAALDRPGRRGIRLLREVLLDAGGESYLERRFLRLMRAAGLPKPEVQVAFRRESERAMRVDFLFPSAALVVEVSGRLGHTSDRHRQLETRRRNALDRQGMRYREFTTVDVVDDPDYVVSEVRTALAASKSRRIH
jgi:very-short-patch-repair endonuclease